MYYAMQMYFANGGGPCYIVSVGTYPSVPAAAPSDADITKANLSNGLSDISKFDEPTLLVFPDATALSAGDYYTLMNEALLQCFTLQDRFTIIDVKHDTSGTNEINSSVDALRNATQLGNNADLLKYGAAYFPNVESSLSYRFNDEDVSIVYVKDGATITEATEDADGSTDVINYKMIKEPPADIKADVKSGLELVRGSISGNTELYNLIKLELNKVTVVMAPSGAMAGIYAAVDSSRGVWKAPANVSMAAVNAATVKISHIDQETMNVDPVSGKSVNAIRYFTGKGLMVWGSRTLLGNDNEWRYVPVRRFFNFAEESIKKGTEWVVFEPNDANTWARVKAMIENFLLKQWRSGALAGAKPEHAFFVRVGLGVTMTALDILEGRMNIEIGMAVVRPAEFIILKFSHKLQES
jgi:phage tail sheath protein FI